MSELQVASRYAKSLIDLATEQKVLDQVQEQMLLFVQVCHENPELVAVLKNPIISLDKKAAVLQGVFGSKVHKIVNAFFVLMVNKGRASLLLPSAKAYIAAYQAIKGIVIAKVKAASALSDDAKKQIIALVKSMGANEVVLETTIDPATIGGFVLQVGDKQVDATLRTKLNKLKKEFEQKVVA
ncbi:MAG: ATP synthase F1 subunit delta [Sphingobacteriales bacterium]|nr:ATP synthase F1 subunit delta [Sphingobacteriales bacterium]